MQPSVVRDVVVVVPGIMGTELLDRDGTPVWSLRARGLVEAIRTLGRSITRLALPAGIGDGPAPDGVRPGRLMPALHVVPGLWRPVAGYSGLLSFLTGPRFHLVPPDPARPDVVPNLVVFGYDWRLSCRHNGALLAAVATDALTRWRAQPGMGEARLVLVCHSMGGLVARWFLEREGGAELTRALITVGTPHRGALRALPTLADEFAPGVGPLRLRLTGFARSLPALHQLLPQYRCVETAGGRSTLLDAGAPGLDGAMTRDAARFHDEITPAGPPPYALHKIVGIRQPTLTTARLVAGRVVALPTIDGLDQGGDGTVPRLAAEPAAGRGSEVHEVADQHGELHGTRSALDLLDGILTRQDLVYEDVEDAARFGVQLDDVHLAGAEIPLRVTGAADRRILADVRDEQGRPVGPGLPVGADGTLRLPPLPPGGYTVRVGASGRGAPTVTHPFLVWPPDDPGAAPG